jgi:hypothetical protein
VADIYVVLTAQVEGNPGTGFGTYHYWDGKHFAAKPDAVSHGFEIRESDDFTIGVVRDGELVSLWWMDDQIGEEPAVLAAITASCDLGRLRRASQSATWWSATTSPASRGWTPVGKRSTTTRPALRLSGSCSLPTSQKAGMSCAPLSRWSRRHDQGKRGPEYFQNIGRPFCNPGRKPMTIQTVRPADALAALNADRFAALIRASIGPEAEPGLWEALTEPQVIARTRAVLSALFTDTQNQIASVRVSAEAGLANPMTGAEQADWRRRVTHFRRLIQRRISYVRERAAQHHAQQVTASPGTGKKARQHNRAALEELARAVLHHREVVSSGTGGPEDDEALRGHLTTITGGRRGRRRAAAAQVAGLPRRRAGRQR